MPLAALTSHVFATLRDVELEICETTFGIQVILIRSAFDFHFLKPGLSRRSLLTLQEDCEPADPANTVTDRLNTLLNTSGPGYVLHLCPGEQYPIQAPILFAFSDQEISTAGYPSGDERATLVVNGPVADGMGHTTAVDGTCSTCSRVKLRNVQVGLALFLGSLSLV